MQSLIARLESSLWFVGIAVVVAAMLLGPSVVEWLVHIDVERRSREMNQWVQESELRIEAEMEKRGIDTVKMAGD